MKHTFCLGTFLGGALVGAGIAMLVTPKTGSEIRNDLRSMAQKGAQKIKNEMDKVHCECNGLDCDCDKEN